MKKQINFIGLVRFILTNLGVIRRRQKIGASKIIVFFQT